MSTILIRGTLTEEEVNRLSVEFPRALFQHIPAVQALTPSLLKGVDALVTNRLTPQELTASTSLRWVHVPQPSLEDICVGDIRAHQNVVLTSMLESNVLQIGEYVMAGLLTFAKCLPEWHKEPSERTRQQMWSLQERVLLQIGLSAVGSEIARQASLFGMHVWGMQPVPTFHPHCRKVLSVDNLHSVLPAVDAICVSLPPNQPFALCLGAKEFELLADDVILVVLGAVEGLDPGAVVRSKKLRGLLVDLPVGQEESPFSSLEQAIVTSHAAAYPRADEQAIFRTLRSNVRLFLQGNYGDMRVMV